MLTEPIWHKSQPWFINNLRNFGQNTFPKVLIFLQINQIQAMEELASSNSLCNHIRSIMKIWNLLNNSWSFPNHIPDKIKVYDSVLCPLMACLTFGSMNIALWLSQYNIMTWSCNLNSLEIPSRHRASLIVSVKGSRQYILPY